MQTQILAGRVLIMVGLLAIAAFGYRVIVAPASIW